MSCRISCGDKYFQNYTAITGELKAKFAAKQAGQKQAPAVEIDSNAILSQVATIQKGSEAKRLNGAYALVLRIVNFIIHVFGFENLSIQAKLDIHENAIKLQQICGKFVTKINLDLLDLKTEELDNLKQILEGAEEDVAVVDQAYKFCKFRQYGWLINGLKRSLEAQQNAGALASFQNFPQPLKNLVYQIVATSHGREISETQFAEELLMRDPSVLLQVRDQMSKCCLDQLAEVFSTLEEASQDLALLALYRRTLSPDYSDKLSAATAAQLIHATDASDQEIRALVDQARETLAAQQSRQSELLLKSLSKGDDQQIAIYDASIDRMRTQFSDQILDKPLTVAMVGAEYSGLLKQGGLAEAVEGLTKAVAQKNHAILIFPKYSTLSSEIAMEKTTQFIGKDGKPMEVYRAMHDGVECYFIDHESFKLSAKNPNIYGPDENTNKKRFFAFSDLAADLLYQMKGIDLIHLHDWHVAGIALKIAKEHRKEWEEGLVPPMVFTFHNNSPSAQGRTYAGAYNYDPIIKQLQESGITNRNTNIFFETLNVADAVTTVSETFASEAQRPDLGGGVSFAVRQAAKVGKFAGIINGTNTTRWNPEADPALKKWVDPATQQPVDLSYGPTSTNILAQKGAAKQQLVKWVERYMPSGRHQGKENSFILDPSKPIVTYVGRFDSHQKGLDKLDAAIKATLENGGQFVLMGSQEDSKAKEILDKLEAKYPTGVLFIRDFKNSKGNFHYQQGDGTMPGISSVLRAATDFVYVPSRFEPCGLVQFEGWLFGSQTIGANTGGIADTVISRSQDPNNFNGYLFQHQGEQGTDAYSVVKQALKDWNSTPEQEKAQVTRRLIADGKKYGWDTSPRGLTPAEKYRFVYEKAIQRVKIRNKKEALHFDVQERLARQSAKCLTKVDPKVLKEERYLKEFYLGRKSDMELSQLFLDLPEDLRTQMPVPFIDKIGFEQYQYYGAIYREGVTTFTIQAPKANQVSVKLYDDQEELVEEIPLKRDEKGDWTLSSNNLRPGMRYRYQIDDQVKIDPYSLHRGATAKPMERAPYSVISDRSEYSWQDAEWVAERNRTVGTSQPMSIFEIHPTAWMRQEDGSPLNYRELAVKLVAHCREAGFTHVELMGILGHDYEKSMGYQVSSFFSPNERLGTPDDFKFLINHLHENKIGVILDWIPAHFANDYYGLMNFDGTSQFEISEWTDYFSKRRRNYDWGTKFFDYRKKEVREFLISSAVYWLKEMHVDGLRVDAVMCMIESEDPVSSALFMRELNAVTHAHCPGTITIAEDLSGNTHTTLPTHLEGLGFDMKWNTAWMVDTLKFFSSPIAQRRGKVAQLIKAIEGDRFHKMVLALSHDEVNVGMKTLLNRCDGLSESERYTNLRGLLSFMMSVPGKKLNFMGNEIAFERNWTEILGTSDGMMNAPEADKAGGKNIFKMMKVLNELYKSHRALWEKDDNGWDVEWLSKGEGADGLVAYRREATNIGKQENVVCLHNFAADKAVEYIIPLKVNERKSLEMPKGLKEIFSSDNSEFGGAGRVNEEIKLVYDGKVIGYRVVVPPQSTVLIEENY